MREKKRGKVKGKSQKELFAATTTWFHIFKAMIDNGDVAKMGPFAATVYMVVKAHTNFSTGRSFPGIETIAEKAGISRRQVINAITTLVELNYITKEKKGRQNVYTLREKIQIADEKGRPAAVASWDYLPNTVRDSVADLKNVLVTGDLAGAKIIHIENLHVNFVQGDQANTHTNNNFQLDIAKLTKTDPKLAETILRLQSKQKTREITPKKENQ